MDHLCFPSDVFEVSFAGGRAEEGIAGDGMAT